MFLSENEKNNVYPCKPQFCYIKVGFKGSKLYRYVFVMKNEKFQQQKCDLFAIFARNWDYGFTLEPPH